MTPARTNGATTNRRPAGSVGVAPSTTHNLASPSPRRTTTPVIPSAPHVPRDAAAPGSMAASSRPNPVTSSTTTTGHTSNNSGPAMVTSL